MTLTWIIDEYLLKDTLSEGFPQVVMDAGNRVITTKYVPFSKENEWSLSIGTPVVLYGTHGFITQTAKYHTPGAYCNEANLKFSVYSGKYDIAIFNFDAKFLPWSHVKKLEWQDFPKGMFIRPDAVTKSFAGRVIGPKDWKHELSLIEDTSSVSDNSWCVVAPAKSIDAEYRFFIVDGKVISGSQYRRDGILDIRTDVSQAAQSLAEEVAECSWQPDGAFVCDIAEDKYGAGILELNSFACAGFYACDQRKIVDAVSALALRDYQEMSAAA